MTNPNHQNLLRAIPAIEKLLAADALAQPQREYPQFPWTPFLRRLTDEFRESVLNADIAPGADPDRVADQLVERALERFYDLRDGGQRRLLNATGVVLHTNVGRGVWGESAIAAAVEAMRGYCNLEMDLASGKRSKRALTLDALIALASDGEAAMVVNNNAAAVSLVVNSFAADRRVIVSRGEMVEIGGSFRMPEILRQAAGEVVEVGTTNRTYPRDYEAVARPGDLLLKVDTSNYRVTGFTNEVSVRELVSVARKTGAVAAYDLGSGAFADFASRGIGDGTSVDQIIATGVDGVTMSGDKLLGGPQAGIIIGTNNFMASIKQNPLRRSVRVDKVTIAAMQAVFREYLFADPSRTVPVVRQVLMDPDELRVRAEKIVAAVPGFSVIDDDGAAGGGSLASAPIPAVAVAVDCADADAAVALARRLRLRPLPVLGRIRGAQLRFNLLAIAVEEDTDLIAALAEEFAQ